MSDQFHNRNRIPSARRPHWDYRWAGAYFITICKWMASISPNPNSISTIVRSYKSAVTKHTRRLGFDFKWQSRFYDHIIRDEKSYQFMNQLLETIKSGQLIPTD